MTKIRDKQFVVIDLESGSYTLYNEGHEKYNELKNPITGKFYGYAPRRGLLNIEKLGAKSYDTEVNDVIVVYVKKIEGSNNRYISSFSQSGTVYRYAQSGDNLAREIIQDGEIRSCIYSIESDELTRIEDIPGLPQFIINILDYSKSMFRMQRFYKGTYPKLDEEIIDYLEKVISYESDIDDIVFQQQLQSTDSPSEDISAKQNASNSPEFGNSWDGRKVKKKVAVSKAALRAANFLCEGNHEHLTFKNSAGLPYMEGHHLIPCTPNNSKFFWDKFGANIDCVENIICLCPTCHRKLHFGFPEERETLLKQLFDARKEALSKIGITIDMTDLIQLYD